MRMLQTLCLSLACALALSAQDTTPPPNDADKDHPQVGERPAETNDTLAPMVVPVGAEIVVRTNEAIDSTTASEGQFFSGTVQEPVINSDGQVLIPKGSDVNLVVRR